MKWGEYSSDVHFILQRTALDATSRNANQQNNKSATARPTKTSVDPLHGFTPPPPPPPPAPTSSISPSNNAAVAAASSPSKDLKKSLTFSGAARSASPADRSRLNVGVVRGVPKRLDNGDDGHTNGSRSDWTDNNKSPSSYVSPPSHVPAAPSHYQLPDGQSSEGQLVYPRYDPPYGRVRLPIASNGSSSDVTSNVQYSSPLNQQDSSPQQHDSLRFPPPYRNPPPPFTG